jgi:Arm DNA-binding domain
MENLFIINQVSYLQWVRRQSESKNGEVSVYITVTCNGQKVQFNSFIRSQEKQWNAKKKQFNGIENEPINAKLRLVISSLQQIELQLSASGQDVTAQSIIQAYQDRLQSKVILT